jgi:Arc/MetJ-type ribon-helix-helix transcriptional regulator
VPGKAISVRLDDEALRALELLEGDGRSTSETIRAALVETARARRRRAALTAEAELLARDPTDRAEMAEVAALMEELGGAG